MSSNASHSIILMCIALNEFNLIQYSFKLTSNLPRVSGLNPRDDRRTHICLYVFPHYIVHNTLTGKK